MSTLVRIPIADDGSSQLCGHEIFPLSMLAEFVEEIVYPARVCAVQGGTCRYKI